MMAIRRFTYGDEPLFPGEAVKRKMRRAMMLEYGRHLTREEERMIRDASERAIAPKPKPQASRSRPGRPRDRALWKAIRKDAARGLPRGTIMEIYAVTEAEYEAALQAGGRGQ